MSGEYFFDNYQESCDQLEHDLGRAERLWGVVYQRIESAYADIEAGRPSLDDIENGKAVSPEKQEADEVGILRECAYEVVQAALVALGAPHG
jgi:hypothetical protein